MVSSEFRYFLGYYLNSTENREQKMSDHTTKKLGLKDAYAVRTPSDNKALYRQWAKSYDSDFADARGYQFPDEIAKVYHRFATESDVPMLDVGAGTGLVGEAVKPYVNGDIDALDLSSSMLAVSASKNIYRNLIETDLTQTVNIESEQYGAVISVGTFTHGHVGPAALYEVLRICKPNALLCIGINSTAFDKYGFGSGFATLQADGLISPLEFIKISCI